MFVIFFLVLRSLAEPPFYCCVCICFIHYVRVCTFRRDDLLFVHIFVSLSAAFHLRFSRFDEHGVLLTATGQNFRYIYWINIQNKQNKYYF